MDILNEQTTDDECPFGEYEEEAVASLIIDHPEFFTSIVRFLKHSLFSRMEVQYVVAHITTYYDKYGVFPSRGMLLDSIKRSLTVDDIGYEDIIRIAGRKSDPREVPALKGQLLDWARSKAYGIIYDPDTIAKYNAGDFESLEEVINQARNIQDIGSGTLWFFDEIEKLFEESVFEQFTTGFSQLDRYIHEGGPARKEMLVWMAPTGVGKSIMLVNNAMANVLDGQNVLYITLELSDVLSAVRALGALTGKPISKKRFDIKDEMLAIVGKIKKSGVGDLAFHEFPPDEISVDEIYALMDHLRRTRGWVPDVVCIDYLELMRSRNATDNNEEYMKQKGISTQVRGLAKNENVLVYTATQTNRSGNTTDESVLDVTKIAESYGKSMPMDYLISINQSQDEYRSQFNSSGVSVHPATARMYIAKNRNGPKFQTIEIKINYSTMSIQETI